MSDRTPTEKLRVRLDELGIEYTANDEKTVKLTEWDYGCGLSAAFAEYDNGTTRFACDTWCFTPEQAIAATIGTPMDADLRKALDTMRIWISEDAHLGESQISYELEKEEGLRNLDAIEQAIAATVGAGTCIYIPDETGFTWCDENEVEHYEEYSASDELRELVRDFYPFVKGRASKPWLEKRKDRMRELGIEVEDA